VDLAAAHVEIDAGDGDDRTVLLADTAQR